MTRRRRCAAGGCENPASGARALFCCDHEHEWVGAAEVPLDGPAIASAHRRRGHEIAEPVWVRIVDVYCSRCRQPYHASKREACIAADPIANRVLRGGPLKRRDAAKDTGEAPADDDAAGKVPVRLGAP